MEVLQRYTDSLLHYFQSEDLEEGLREFGTTCTHSHVDWFSAKQRGDLDKYQAIFEKINTLQHTTLQIKNSTLHLASEQEFTRLELQIFHPWRKGPFQIDSQFIDTEWRSDWKWERVAASGLDLAGKTVLDIGCGNGYYLWRMQELGAKLAIGIDPYLPYVMQFLLMRAFAPQPNKTWVFPVGVEALPSNATCFDVVFSMGILYHRKSPFDHLIHLRELIKKGGELILETIVLPDEQRDCLVPEGRYAKMKNVWFLPSVSTLCSWLKKCRFREIEVVHFGKTTTEEQRSTEWMTFESLSDFLNPNDDSQTLEGHPAPYRVVIRARV